MLFILNESYASSAKIAAIISDDWRAATGKNSSKLVCDSLSATSEIARTTTKGTAN